MPTAVLIDGAYFLRRFRSSFPEFDATCPKDIARAVISLARFHVVTRLQAQPVLQAIDGGAFDLSHSDTFRPEESPELYRIFFYNCPPLTKRVHFPVSGNSLVLGKTEEAVLRTELHKELQSIRKVALRLGRLNEEFSSWKPKQEAVQRWLANPSAFCPTDDDFSISPIQKGVDMRLGLDVASIAFKKQADQLVLVAGDADFVPAAKMARREGLDVILDPMFGNAASDLRQHVDGERNCLISGHPMRGFQAR
jgi:uncharacterized LabA/DUF88 family protein